MGLPRTRPDSPEIQQLVNLRSALSGLIAMERYVTDYAEVRFPKTMDRRIAQAKTQRVLVRRLACKALQLKPEKGTQGAAHDFVG